MSHVSHYSQPKSRCLVCVYPLGIAKFKLAGNRYASKRLQKNPWILAGGCITNQNRHFCLYRYSLVVPTRLFTESTKHLLVNIQNCKSYIFYLLIYWNRALKCWSIIKTCTIKQYL